MRKTLEAAFYYLWKLFHTHRWQYLDYARGLDTYHIGPVRSCQEPECQKLEYWNR